MKKLEEKQNTLFNRNEVKIIIEGNASPNKQDAIKIIAETFNVAEERIAIKEIGCKFGRNTFLINAFIYDTKEAKEQFEKKKVKKKEGAEDGEAPLEKSAEEKPAKEKLAEEKSIEAEKTAEETKEEKGREKQESK